LHLPATDHYQEKGMNELNAVDGALLERLQSGFPLTPRPFAALGDALGLDEDEVIACVGRLKEGRIVRQMGAIFDTRRLGYQSTLVAFHVGDSALESTAAQVSAHPGVSHNYARSHHYNLWFTLAVPSGGQLLSEIRRLAQETGVDDWLNLPALRVFKIRAHFRLQDGSPRAEDEPHSPATQQRAFTPADIPYVRALQQDLPLDARPFARLAERWDMDEDDLLARAGEMKAAGIMRRFGAVLHHREVGFQANGMGCWVVPEAGIEQAGRLAARHVQVSHCYQRPAYPPRWPYTLFTMIHGRTENEVEAVVAEIAGEIGIAQAKVLYSTREFKKERVRYFEEKP
jgi:DNA-binding Lrp family transcriptional regulator